MKLRTKTLLIVVTTIVSLLVILYLLTNNVLLSGFTKVEHEDTERNVQRVMDAIGENVNNLSIKAADWAKWDDTYKFISDHNAEYIESNLTDESLAELKLNIMLFVDKDRKIVFGRSFDLETGEGSEIPVEMKSQVMSDTVLFVHPDVEHVMSGILRTVNGEMFIVSRPILTSVGEGPVNGSLIFGRFFDKTEIDRISQITHLQLTILPYASKDLPSDMKIARSELNDSLKIIIYPLNEKTIAGYSRLLDIKSKPAMVARIEVPRRIYHQGQLTMLYLILSILGAGIAFGVIIILLLEITVLSRVGRLNDDITTIGKKSDRSGRVRVRGKDELAALALSMNGMLDAIQRGEMEIRTRNREMSLIMSTVPSGLLSITDTCVINPEYSKSVETILGLTGLAGKNYFDILGFTEDKTEERRKLIDFLDLLRQEILPEKDMAGLNPFEELCISAQDQKWIMLNYFVIRRGENLPNHVLVVVEDISQKKKMQARIAQSERENMQLKAIAEDPDLFKEFLVETRQIITHAEKSLGTLMSAADKKAVVNEVFRDVHTIKGTAGSFGLSAVSEISGQMEDALNPLRSTGAISIEMIDATKQSLALLSGAVRDVVENAKRLLGDDIGDSAEVYLRISLDKLKREAEVIRTMVAKQLMNSGEGQRILSGIDAEFRMLRSIPARKGFAKALKIIPGLIKRFNKKVAFDLEGADTLVDCETARELNTALVHLIRNSFDHGIEEPEERTAIGKPEQGVVKLSIVNNGSLKISISDDGRGMNPEILKSAAVKKGLLTSDEAARLTADQAYKLILAPGFSTAQTVTDISGRGVGMDAVMVTVDKLNGNLKINSQEGKGTSFLIDVPEFTRG